MAGKYKEYLVVEVRLGTTFKPSYRVRKFISLANMKKWAFNTETRERKEVTVYKITHKANGISLKSVY